MTKKKRMIHQKLAKILVSVFILAVFAAPAYLAVKSIAGMSGLGADNNRRVSDVDKLSVRTVDDDRQPLKPFQEPLFSITFDDGWGSVYSEALPILQKRGIRTTQYVLSGTLEHPSYMSVAQLKSMRAAGHEMASHTISHADLSALSDPRVETELTVSKDDLSRQLGPIKDFSSPLGAYNDQTVKLIDARYRSHKTTKGDPVIGRPASINTGDDFTPMNIKGYTVRNYTTLKDIEELLESARKQNGWVVLTYHQVDRGGSLYSVTPEVFEAQMKLVSGSNLRSVTVGQMLDALGVK